MSSAPVSRRTEWVRAREVTRSRPARPRRSFRDRGEVVYWRGLSIPATAVGPGTWVPSRRHPHCLTRVAEVERTPGAQASFRCGDGTEIVADLTSRVLVARVLAVGSR